MIAVVDAMMQPLKQLRVRQVAVVNRRYTNTISINPASSTTTTTASYHHVILASDTSGRGTYLLTYLLTVFINSR